MSWQRPKARVRRRGGRGPQEADLRRAASIVVLGMLLLSAGCGGQPRIRRLSESSVVVAFGDSLTSGTGASGAESYPSQLSDLIGCRVVNAGVPGEDTSSGLGRLPAVLRKESPDLLTLCHGGNDMLGKQPQGLTQRNLDAMIAMAKKAGSDVILVGVPKPGLLLKVPPFYRKLARDHGLPLDSDTVPEILRTPSLKSDQIHPNAAGYRRMAESIAELIRGSEGL